MTSRAMRRSRGWVRHCSSTYLSVLKAAAKQVEEMLKAFDSSSINLPLADNNTNTKLGRANGNNIAVCLLIPVDVTVTDVSPAINSFIKV